MKRLGRLSLEQHIALGREMYEKRDELLKIACTLSNSYGIGTQVSKYGHRLVGQVDQFRSRLDGQFARDYPGSYCPDVYYPGPEDTRRTHERIGCNTCYPKKEN